MKKLLFVLFYMPTLLVAQINETDTVKFKANLSLTGLYQGGNVETLIFRAKSELTYIPWKKWVYKTRNSYVYQEFGKTKADEDILSLNFLYFNPEKRVYPFALGFFSTNFRREIEHRYLYGAGVTFQLLQEEYSWLKCSISGEYEQTDFASATFNLPDYNGMNRINTLRGTLWINGRYHVVKDKIIFSHESYIQPSLEDNNNYRWRADVSLEFPVVKYLNFKINYLHSFESLVIENQQREDQFLTFGLTIKSY